MASAGKVLIIVQNLPVPFDRRVWREARALTDAGYQVSIISPKGKHGKYQENFQELENIQIYRYPAPFEAKNTAGYIMEFAYCWLATAVLSLRVLINQGFDVIQACNPPETYFLLGFFYKLFGKGFIFDHHDLSPEMYLAKGGEKGGLLYHGLLWLEKLTFNTAEVVITTNQSHKQIAVERGNFPEEDIFIVRNGPSSERLQRLPPEPAIKDGYTYLVCYLGEMCVQDGVDYLLKSIQHLVFDMRREDTKFILMGGGPELEELKRMSKSLGLEGFVEFTGRVSDHDLCRFLSTADVCVDPDPYTEWSNQSTMNKIMEYMAFGKPIVAFDLKEHRFSAQKAALYTPANDIKAFAENIDQLLDHETRREEMGAYALERVHQVLAWEFSVPKLLEAYDKAFEID
mgnify:FL=1